MRRKMRRSCSCPTSPSRPNDHPRRPPRAPPLPAGVACRAPSAGLPRPCAPAHGTRGARGGVRAHGGGRAPATGSGAAVCGVAPMGVGGRLGGSCRGGRGPGCGGVASERRIRCGTTRSRWAGSTWQAMGSIRRPNAFVLLATTICHRERSTSVSAIRPMYYQDNAASYRGLRRRFRLRSRSTLPRIPHHPLPRRPMGSRLVVASARLRCATTRGGRDVGCSQVERARYHPRAHASPSHRRRTRGAVLRCGRRVGPRGSARAVVGAKRGVGAMGADARGECGVAGRCVCCVSG